MSSGLWALGACEENTKSTHTHEIKINLHFFVIIDSKMEFLDPSTCFSFICDPRCLYLHPCIQVSCQKNVKAP